MPKTYSVKEAAVILGFSTNTIYTYLNEKKLKGVRIGKGRFRIPQSEMDRMTGIVSASPSSKGAGIEPRLHIVDNLPILRQTVPFLRQISLTDWYVGLGSIIFGFSMFVYTAAVEHVAAAQFTVWYWILRLLFILFGVGFLVSKLYTRIPAVWQIIYHSLLIASFGWFVVISHLAHDPQGTVIGFLVCFLMIMLLLFTPSYHSVISTLVLVTAVMNTVLFVFTPDYLTLVTSSFGAMIMPGIWGYIMVIGVPYIVYLLLVLTHRLMVKLYYFLIILGSLWCIVAGYFTGANLYWRHGLIFLFTGVFLFLYATLQTKAMRENKTTWSTGMMVGFILIMFLAVILSLRIFELTMYDYAGRELQVKAENGKLYLETIFNYAQNSFHVQTTDSTLIHSLEKKDRTALTAYAKTMYEQYPHMYRIVILDKEGTELANFPEDQEIFGDNFAYRTYFQEALTIGNTVFSDVIQTTGTMKRYTIVMATPIVVNKGVYGVIAGSFDMDEINRNLQSFGADEGGEYFEVLDQKGVQLVNINKVAIGTSISKEDLGKFDNIPYWKAHLDTRVDPDGKLVLTTYRTVPYGNINIAVVQPYRENLQTNRVAFAIAILVGGYGYLLILGVWYVCYRKYKSGGTRG